MNILQQIWTHSTIFSDFLVNLVHAVALVPVIDHDVVAVGETVQFFTIPSVNGGKIAVAIVGGRRFGRGRLKVSFQTTSMLTANEIVKEQMIQTTSKKIVRSSLHNLGSK